jgi:hypothetical protein
MGPPNRSASAPVRKRKTGTSHENGTGRCACHARAAAPQGARKAVGDARLCADLVKRGIDRDAALTIVAEAPLDEHGRITAAYEKIRRIQPQLQYPSIARKLERLGFPSSLIYRVLRERAAGDLQSSFSAAGAGDDV